MSSACVCHIEGDFCFYCEIYSPLERKHEIQTGEIERVIAELEENAKRHMVQEAKTFNAGGTGYVIDREARRAYEVAVLKLKEVIASEDNNPRNVTEPERDGQQEQSQ